MQSTEQKKECWVEDKTGKILLQTSIRGKNACAQEPRSLGFNRTIKRPNLRVTKTERAEIDIKGINNLFNEIVKRHFINSEKEINTQTQDVF